MLMILSAMWTYKVITLRHVLADMALRGASVSQSELSRRFGGRALIYIIDFFFVIKKEII